MSWREGLSDELIAWIEALEGGAGFGKGVSPDGYEIDPNDPALETQLLIDDLIARFDLEGETRFDKTAEGKSLKAAKGNSATDVILSLVARLQHNDEWYLYVRHRSYDVPKAWNALQGYRTGFAYITTALLGKRPPFNDCQLARLIRLTSLLSDTGYRMHRWPPRVDQVLTATEREANRRTLPAEVAMALQELQASLTEYDRDLEKMQARLQSLLVVVDAGPNCSD